MKHRTRDHWLGTAKDRKTGYLPPGTSTTERGGERLRFPRSDEPRASEPLILTPQDGTRDPKMTPLPKRMAVMIYRYGVGPEGAKCGDCKHFVGHAHARTYWKCDLSTVTGGAATDWRMKWPACGKFEARRNDD